MNIRSCLLTLPLPPVSYADWICNVNTNAVRFTGTVGAVAETNNKAPFGTIYVDHISLWAEVQGGSRYSGNAISYEYPLGSSPQEVLTYIYAANDMLL